jgi:hypothetical protein
MSRVYAECPDSADVLLRPEPDEDEDEEDDEGNDKEGTVMTRNRRRLLGVSVKNASIAHRETAVTAGKADGFASILLVPKISAQTVCQKFCRPARCGDGRQVVGIVHPCKIYNVLAANRAFLYIRPTESHLRDIVRQPGLEAYVATHGNVDGVVANILHA